MVRICSLFFRSRGVLGHVTLHLLEDRLGELDGCNDDWKHWTGQTNVEAPCATSVTPSICGEKIAKLIIFELKLAIS